jgi:hypothetical protein
VRAEASAETRQPPIVHFIGRTLAEGTLEREEHRWAAHVAAVAQLRDQGVSYRWISRTLHMSAPRIVSSLVFRLRERRMA